MGMGSMDIMFNIFPILFILVFIIILCVFVVILVKGVSQWRQNNQSPVLTVEAEVVAKRGDVSRHDDTASTTYYATFQVESGDRMELHIPRDQYGMLAEGDQGKLTFQGTRYLGFDRSR